MVIDALHLVPSLLEAIHQAAGTYLIGLKVNQWLLHRCLIQTLVAKTTFERVDDLVRGHGRINQRTYRYHSLAALTLDKRWATTVVVVMRVR